MSLRNVSLREYNSNNDNAIKLKAQMDDEIFIERLKAVQNQLNCYALWGA